MVRPLVAMDIIGGGGGGGSGGCGGGGHLLYPDDADPTPPPSPLWGRACRADLERRVECFTAFRVWLVVIVPTLQPVEPK